ncbi:MAG: hypothetical protein ABMA00_11435 [Gemmatimonas sp.]
MLMPTDYRPPDWAPLQRALAAEFGATAVEAAAAFWFIGYIDGPADVGELRLYEHSVTRRRLVLDPEGGAYRYFAAFTGYSRISIEEALVDALS